MFRSLTFSALVALIALSISLLITETVIAQPTSPSPAPTNPPKKPNNPGITINQLKKGFAGNCPTSAATPEIITCEDALPFINRAIKKYRLKTRGQKAAYVANMAFEGGYLKYNHNLQNPSQGTRSIMPAVSLRAFVNANKSVQKLWPGYPNNVNDSTIVDVLIKNKLDFEPGAWWTVSGPDCATVAKGLTGVDATFLVWEKTCIRGGEETIQDRLKIYTNVYKAFM
ncbi:hypothetical protein BGZ65_004943 [Modicella reniformis]|uniref:Uncharacterized protein n=1 Tax=Modicella reniformis TaxID=1440133 RepID=A0A9P6IXU8_9FUNG|nr:hypothetical protein BGZ65_004943 [Modicella reniformis]